MTKMTKTTQTTNPARNAAEKKGMPFLPPDLFPRLAEEVNVDFFRIIPKLETNKRFGGKLDDTSSHSMRVALYGIIAGLLEKERYGQDVDVAQIACAGIFHDMNEHRLGPIDHQTKKDAEVAELIAKLEHETNLDLVSWVPVSMRAAFQRYIVEAENPETLEGLIVDAIDSFDALMVCHRECEKNTASPRIRDTFHTLHQALQQHELASVRDMMAAFDARDSFYHFLWEILEFDQVPRFQGENNLVQDHDAVHTWRAAAMGIFFAELERQECGQPIDMLRLTGKILGHDLAEVRTGDVKGPTKKATAELRDAFIRYEKSVAEKMVAQLPDCLQPYFTDFMVNAKDDTYMGYLVELVDKTDALLKCDVERKLGNTAYEEKFEAEMEKYQRRFGNPAAVFYLSYIQPKINA